MKSVLLVCGGCGVRIRTTNPAKARDRACPRCESSLGPAVDRVLGVEPKRPSEIDTGLVVATRPRALRVVAGLAIVLVAIGVPAALAFRGSSPVTHKASDPVRPSIVANRTPTPQSAPTEVASTPDQPEEKEVPESQLEVADLPPPPPVKDLAILEPPDGRDINSILRLPDIRSRTTPLDQPPPPPPGPTTSADPSSTASTEPRRLVVRGKKGRAIVAREHGMVKDRLTVLLPDGQIRWLDSEVVTKDPFVPATMEEMRRSFVEDPEFATFRLLQTAHYLILYQGKTDTFAKASGELLEKLHDGLTGVLRKNGLPVKPMEFPLVAVIFETEADFRANRQVAPDIQAYYEILSNRIYFYEKSKRDQDSPEVSALRKPQTVAHEGTHQILHNVGIQPRMSDWPLWLVEGLAEYCSPPKITKRGVDWAGLGQVNPLHMATIRDLDHPLPNQFHGGNRQPIASRDRKTPLVEYLVTQKELTPTDYALAWALTHYLATKRLDEFVAYIKRMSELKPGQEQTAQSQLAAFREVFGSDLTQMDGKVAKHLNNLKSPDVLPFYAVIFEQQVGTMLRRQAMVSQSPSMIRQWLESATVPHGAEPHWQFLPQPNRNTAIEVVDQWMRHGQ